MTRQKFLDEAARLYGDRYDYSNVSEESVVNEANVPVRCSKHGLFWITPHQHIRNGVGCFECFKEAAREKLRKKGLV